MILLQSFLANRFLTTEFVILKMFYEGDFSPSGLNLLLQQTFYKFFLGGKDVYAIGVCTIIT